MTAVIVIDDTICADGLRRSPHCRAFATNGKLQPGQKVLINGASGGVGRSLHEQWDAFIANNLQGGAGDVNVLIDKLQRKLNLT
jgi:FlaA1/EpsC-like NDP-sugar epimerase